jgi:endonuclease-3 related protein
MESPGSVYRRLLEHFGPQGWWPKRNCFSPPELEVCVGAILTQNTAWKNVEKALENLREAGCTDLKALAGTSREMLEGLIRPSGFYRQKAGYLKGLFGFMEGRSLKDVAREELLALKGIGPETADSILLYACGKPRFVVDMYTRRVFSRLGLLKEQDYHRVQAYFESSLPRDVEVYREFHALIVELAKGFCRAKPACSGCPLGEICEESGKTFL